MYHMGKILTVSVGFWKLGITNKSVPHGEGLDSACRCLETMDNKQVSTDTLTELAEVVLTNNIFEFNKNTFKQKRGTTIEQSLHLLMLFFSCQSLRTKYYKVLKRNQ